MTWREADDRCVMWTVETGHPLAAGVPNPLVIPADEMYCEPFGIPAPDELVFVSSYSGGRSCGAAAASGADRAGSST